MFHKRGHSFLLCLLLLISASFFLLSDMAASSYQKTGDRPSPQIYHAMVYHTNAHRILLFGGQSKSGWVADIREIWAYDVMNETWERAGVYEANPVKGSAQAPAYDSESDRVVVLNTEGETWAYHYEKRLWEKRNPMQTPKTRAGHRMAYDSESDRIILFGGFEAKNVNSPVYGETWAYDYNADTWTLMDPERRPPKRMYHGMAYDSESDRVIVWGGRLLERLDDNAVWAYDFNTNAWTRHDSPEAPQPELTYPGMVYRSASDQIVIFGGAEIITPFDCEVTRQTWAYEFNANTWMRLSPETTPPSMGKHAIAYDARNDKIVVFGGEVDRLYSDHILDETWVYDPKNNSWEKKE